MPKKKRQDAPLSPLPAYDLIEECVDASLLRSSPSKLLSEERCLVKSLCLFASFGILSTVEERRMMSLIEPRMVSSMERFCEAVLGANMDSLAFKLTDIVQMEAIPVKISQLLLECGAGCIHARATSPFAERKKSKKEDRPVTLEFMRATLEAFEALAPDLAALWSEHLLSGMDTSAAGFPLATGMLLHECAAAFYWRCKGAKALGSLLLEHAALCEYLTVYKRVPNNNTDKGPTRTMFWTAAFFLAQIDPKWDAHLGKASWRQGALAKYKARFTADAQIFHAFLPKPHLEVRLRHLSYHGGVIRHCLFNCFFACVHRIHSQSQFCHDLERAVLKLQAYGEKVADARAKLFELVIEIGRYFPKTMDFESELRAHFTRIDLICSACEGTVDPSTAIAEQLIAETIHEIAGPMVERRLAKAKLAEEMAAARLRAGTASTVLVDAAQDLVLRRAATLPTPYRQALVMEMEADVKRIASRAMLDQCRKRTLPANFALEAVMGLMPTLRPDPHLEGLLHDVPCFICFTPLDFSAPNNGFLLCCEGGSFACAGCVERHERDFKHKPLHSIASRRLVHLIASIRKDMRVREFAPLS